MTRLVCQRTKKRHNVWTTSNVVIISQNSQVLQRNGTAVDAAVATLFCNGLFSCHSMGIGGGFVMTVYNKASGIVDTLDARETAPAAAKVDMFHGNPEASTKGKQAQSWPGSISYNLHAVYC